MAGSRVPGPTGRNDPEYENGDWGLLGSGEMPGPLGLETGPQQGEPLKRGSKNKKKKPAPTELSLVGSYPKPAAWTPKKEKELIGKDTWFPHTQDFLKVAGKDSLEITSPDDFLLKIMEARGPIGRLNYFSHGVTGEIATSGTVDPEGRSCSLDTGWTSVIGAKRIADPYAQRWGDSGEDSGSVTVTVGDKTFSLNDVRAKFKDAELWLYICHGGADPMLLQNIANTFQVKVKAFSEIIVYCAPPDFPTNRQHKVNVLTSGSKPSASCPGAVSDFHQLSADRGASPKKP